MGKQTWVHNRTARGLPARAPTSVRPGKQEEPGRQGTMRNGEEPSELPGSWVTCHVGNYSVCAKPLNMEGSENTNFNMMPAGLLCMAFNEFGKHKRICWIKFGYTHVLLCLKTHLDGIDKLVPDLPIYLWSVC